MQNIAGLIEEYRYAVFPVVLLNDSVEDSRTLHQFVGFYLTGSSRLCGRLVFFNQFKWSYPHLFLYPVSKINELILGASVRFVELILLRMHILQDDILDPASDAVPICHFPKHTDPFPEPPCYSPRVCIKTLQNLSKTVSKAIPEQEDFTQEACIFNGFL